MSRSGYLKPFYDTGIIGVGSDCFGCLVKNEIEAEYILKLLKSKLYNFYINVNKWSGFHHLTVLQSLPYINIENINDVKIYEFFNLNENEIKIITSIE